jgi:hypothetical protein
MAPGRAGTDGGVVCALAARDTPQLLRSRAGSALIARFDNLVAGRALVAPVRPEHRRSAPSIPWKP